MSHARDYIDTVPSGLRLLPWESESGKPCFLAADDSEGPLSRLADEIEENQLQDAADVLAGARAVLDDRVAGEFALRQTLLATTQVLRVVLRVAASRGARIPQRSDGP
ncbi:hypothetical protein [Streptomyces sp. NPDC006132]|uniref:hypothetical protein n=1 Tax=Streptomyces sp. NPDC006132 TaxID=3156732 RepID=UPI0033DB829C